MYKIKRANSNLDGKQVPLTAEPSRGREKNDFKTAGAMFSCLGMAEARDISRKK